MIDVIFRLQCIIIPLIIFLSLGKMVDVYDSATIVPNIFVIIINNLKIISYFHFEKLFHF